MVIINIISFFWGFGGDGNVSWGWDGDNGGNVDGVGLGMEGKCCCCILYYFFSKNYMVCWMWF